ncbi:MAG: hypothetical protein J3K34DRAFT_430419 [Monoraphidium minutum]|nr:MAG: hypothetical protein J3K34DRAFT_430419 [Monoraphidium minutum]
MILSWGASSRAGCRQHAPAAAPLDARRSAASACARAPAQAAAAAAAAGAWWAPQQPRRCRRLRAAAAAADGGEPLARVERMRAELDALAEELRRASEAGELCARRSRRLRERGRQLSDYALEHVAAGDEAAARSALEIKASVRTALEGAARRAVANAALAAKLEGVIERKQLELLQAIREARTELERRSAADDRGGSSDGGETAAEAQQRELRRVSSGGRRASYDGGDS